MDYVIFSNPRFIANDFKAEYHCDFCPKPKTFHSKLILVPKTGLKICSTCLNKLSEALNKGMIDEFKAENIHDASLGGRERKQGCDSTDSA